MSSAPRTRPIEDSVPKLNNELAVGEDLNFQRRWWRFEHGVWFVFALIVALDLSGAFGRGPLAHAHINAPDGSLQVDFDRIQRTGTPSIVTVHFGPNAMRGHTIQLWVSQSILKDLGNQRIIPQPAESAVGGKGVLYSFPATLSSASIEFALEPSGPGIFSFELRVPGASTLNARVYVMP